MNFSTHVIAGVHGAITFAFSFSGCNTGVYK